MNIRQGLAAGALALGLAVVAPFSLNAMAAEITGGDGQTAQQVIDKAAAGDTVVLTAAQNNTSFKVDKPLTITANGNVVLSGATIASKDVTIDGADKLTFTNAGKNLITFKESAKAAYTDVTIKNTKFFNGNWAIFTGWSKMNLSGLKVEHNTFDSIDHALFARNLYNTKEVYIGYNTLSDGLFQVTGATDTKKIVEDGQTKTVVTAVYPLTNFVFEHNVKKSDQSALLGVNMIRFGYIENAKISDNYVKYDASTRSGGYGFGLIAKSDNIKFINNYVSNAAMGFAVLRGDERDGNEYDSDAAASSNITFENNTVDNSTMGIAFGKQSLVANTELVLKDNKFNNTDTGIVDGGTGRNLTDKDNVVTPSESNKTPSTDNTTEQEAATDDNANGVKAPNTGANNIVNVLMAVLGLSTVSMAGAVYAYARVRKFNK